MATRRTGNERDAGAGDEIVDAEYVEVEPSEDSVAVEVVEPPTRHTTDDLVRDRPARPPKRAARTRAGGGWLSAVVARRRRPLSIYGAAIGAGVVVLSGIVATVQHARIAARAKTERVRLLAFYESLVPEAGPSAIAADFVPRGQAVSGGIRSVSLLDAASARVEGELGDDPALESHARQVLGNAYRVLGASEPARRELGRALELTRSAGGATSRAYARCATALAAADAAGGDARSAERLLREALAILDEGGLRDEARWLATAELGTTRYRRGDLDGADRELAEALEGLRANVGVKHAALPVILANLGVIADLRGDLAAAARYYQHGLDGVAAISEDANPEAAWLATRLAALQLVKGRDAEAQQLLEKAMDTWGRTVGSDHPSTIATRARLAQALARQRAAARAEPIAREALVLAMHSRPEGHDDRALAQTALGEVLIELGRANEAEALLRTALASRRRAAPEGSAAAASTAGLLVDCLIAQNRVAEAEPIAAEAVREVEMHQGLASPRTRIAIARLAELYERTNRHAAAAELLGRLDPKAP